MGCPLQAEPSVILSKKHSDVVMSPQRTVIDAGARRQAVAHPLKEVQQAVRRPPKESAFAEPAFKVCSRHGWIPLTGILCFEGKQEGTHSAVAAPERCWWQCGTQEARCTGE